MKPSTASFSVTQMLVQIDPNWVPCLNQFTSCVTIPLGLPQKNGSTMLDALGREQLPAAEDQHEHCDPRQHQSSGPSVRRLAAFSAPAISASENDCSDGLSLRAGLVRRDLGVGRANPSS